MQTSYLGYCLLHIMDLNLNMVAHTNVAIVLFKFCLSVRVTITLTAGYILSGLVHTQVAAGEHEFYSMHMHMAACLNTTRLSSPAAVHKRRCTLAIIKPNVRIK